MNPIKKSIKIEIALCLFLTLSAISTMVQENIAEVNFKNVQGTETDHERTLKSIVKVRNISEQYSTGGLYLITHYGTLAELFQKENKQLIDHPWIE